MSKKPNLCSVNYMSQGGYIKGGEDSLKVKCTSTNDANKIVDEIEAAAKKKADIEAAQLPQSAALSEIRKDDGTSGASGGADIKSKYKKTLNKKTLEDLRKMAKGKGIKITTKKDGKSVYLKKSSIINKLCNFKHPKKPVKKTTKRK